MPGGMMGPHRGCVLVCFHTVHRHNLVPHLQPCQCCWPTRNDTINRVISKDEAKGGLGSICASR